MSVRVSHVVVDCRDARALARFWSELLGLAEVRTANSDESWVDLAPLGGGGPFLSFQEVPEGKQVKNRLHLDLDVDDVEAVGRRVGALGGRIAEGQPPVSGVGYQVWHDPEGNEFCLVHPLVAGVVAEGEHPGPSR